MSKKVCTNCGSQRRPKREAKGSFVLECFLWFIGILTIAFFPIVLLVAFIYTLWRGFSHAPQLCRDCDAPNMVPIDSPKGKAIVYGGALEAK